MTFSGQECDRIREEEMARLQARLAMKRQQRPQLFLLMVLWTSALTLLALTTMHFRCC